MLYVRQTFDCGFDNQSARGNRTADVKMSQGGLPQVFGHGSRIMFGNPRADVVDEEEIEKLW